MGRAAYCDFVSVDGPEKGYETMTNKALIIGGAIAAYLLRDHIEQALGFSNTATATNSAPTDSAPANSAPPAAPPPPPAGVWQQLAAWGETQSTTGTLSADQWNVGYKLIRGVPGPAPEDIGLDHARLITAVEYQAAMVSKGLNGIGRTPVAVRQRANAQSFTRRAWGY
jgi:hypothetical protein